MEFDELFTRFYPAVHRYAFRLTGDGDEADDVAQEAFVRMMRADLRGLPSERRAWLFRTALNLVRDRARVRSNRRRLLDENPGLPLPDHPEDPERRWLRNEEIRGVREILETLAERDRVLLLMREEGFSYREMARTVDVAPNSVGTLLARAQERFASAYRDMERENDASSDG